MKKLLLSFLPVLLALTTFTAKAQDTFSATVTWDTPGAIKVLKGSSPANGTEVEIGADATSYTVNEKEDYMFIPTEGNYIESAMMDGKALKLIKNTTDGGTFFKLEGKYKSGTYNGKTIELTTKAFVYDREFTLTIDNGADKITFQLQDKDGNLTRNLTPADGEQTIKLSQVDAKLYMQGSGNPSPEFHTATINGEAITSSYGRYTTPVDNGDKVYIALEDPETATPAKECEVKFVFTNNNPDCLSNLYNWGNSSFIKPDELVNSNYTIKIDSGTDLQINLIDDAGYTFNDITFNPSTAVTVVTENKKYTINDNVTFTIDVTSNVIEDVTATLYTNDINGVTLTQKYGEPETALTTTEKGTHAANSLGTTFPAIINIPTTEYTINGISGKDKKFFFEAKEGYWVKEAFVANREKQPGDPNDYYVVTSALANVDECPLFLNLHKIDYTTPAVIYYEGSEDCAIAVVSSAPDGAEVPYQGKLSTFPQGYSRIQFDPEYNATFTARFMEKGETAGTNSYYAYVDGKAVAVSQESESVFSGIKLGENSVLKLFYAPATAAPKTHTLNFTVEEGATAKVTYDEIITTSDFSNPITNIGTVKYAFAPAEGTEIIVNGTALEAPYEYTPEAGATVEVKIAKKADLPKLSYTVTPEDGVTVKTLSKVTLTFGFTPEMMNGEATLNFAENAAELIKIEKNGEVVPVTGYVEPGSGTDTEMPIVFSLASPITEAGEYTITISEGLVFTTKWDEATEGFIRDASSAVNEAKTLKVTVDPAYQYKWSFDPENGSEKNPMPEDYVDIQISLPEADDLSDTPFDIDSDPETPTYAGPWLTYNETPLARMDEEGNGDWEIIPAWGQPALKISINASVFTTPGELVIKADEGAFTVNYNEPSPAFEYSASFGEKKNYTVTFTPAADTEVKAEDIRTITATFEEAESIKLGEYFYGMFSQGFSSGIQINSENVTIEGNKLTVTLPESYDVTPGTASLMLYEGSLILDGNQLSPEIKANWTVVRTTPVSFKWEASPSTAVVNEGYGMNVALIFDDYETVSIRNREAITVEFNGEKLGTLDYDNPANMGYDIMAGSGDYPNALMFTAAGGALQDKETEGELKVTIPAGAIAISGEATPEEITNTWKLVKAKEYTVRVTPANGETVAGIEKIKLEFIDADKAELFHSGFTMRDDNYNFYEVSVFTYAAASYPTFDINLTNPITEAGTYTFQMNRGAFTLDGIYESPAVEAVITVDPAFQGISDLSGDAANGKFTVINLQGIVVMKDASAEDLKTLSTGIYIINGKKISIK